MHYHKCPCGTIWSHGDDQSIPDTPEAVAADTAHKCPKCGERTFERYQPTAEELKRLAYRECIERWAKKEPPQPDPKPEQPQTQTFREDKPHVS